MGKGFLSAGRAVVSEIMICRHPKSGDPPFPFIICQMVHVSIYKMVDVRLLFTLGNLLAAIQKGKK